MLQQRYPVRSKNLADSAPIVQSQRGRARRAEVAAVESTETIRGGSGVRPTHVMDFRGCVGASQQRRQEQTLGMRERLGMFEELMSVRGRGSKLTPPHRFKFPKLPRLPNRTFIGRHYLSKFHTSHDDDREPLRQRSGTGTAVPKKNFIGRHSRAAAGVTRLTPLGQSVGGTPSVCQTTCTVICLRRDRPNKNYYLPGGGAAAATQLSLAPLSSLSPHCPAACPATPSPSSQRMRAIASTRQR